VLTISSAKVIDDIGSFFESIYNLVPEWYRTAVEEDQYGTAFLTFFCDCTISCFVLREIQKRWWYFSCWSGCCAV
jgi:hypothetical protein